MRFVPVTSAPTLRENALGVRSFTPAMAARAQAGLFAAAGIVGALGVLLPHPARYFEPGMLTVQMSSLVSALLLLWLKDRVPAVFLTVGPYGAGVLTSVVLVFDGSSTSPYLLFYLWVGFYAFYFLPRRQAAALTLFTVLSYVAVILWFRHAGVSNVGTQANEDVSAMVLITGTLTVAGVFILLLRERVGRLIAQLVETASSDSLTGLPNRRGLHTALDAELARSERSGAPFSVLLGDCDLFKRLNDSHGHHAGDEALVAISALLTREKRPFDVAARIGGEEFAVLLPGCGQHDALRVAERLRTQLAEAFAGQPVALTMSFGVGSWPDHALTVDDLLRAADDALYAAKSMGRNRSVLHSAEIEGILATDRDGTRSRDQAQLVTVLNLAEALDLRDTGTALHSQTVGRYCEAMAVHLGLDAERVDRVRLAGVLHDVGKIGVPDSVLMKPGPLTDDEFDLMRKHPEIGERILGGTGLDDIRRWILAHHERPDGRGYPFGLAGEEIPLEARILAVADAYEAMTSDRVYRKAIGPERARAQLLECSGSQFDPGVARVFLEVLTAGDPVADVLPVAVPV
jgi:diguanylate cyclase (GGDEF)-like protein